MVDIKKILKLEKHEAQNELLKALHKLESLLKFPNLSREKAIELLTKYK